MSNRRRADKLTANWRRVGFSLIEVVVAVAVFAIAATVLTSSFVNALLAREHGRSQSLRAADIRAVRLQLLLEPDIERAEEGDRYDTLSSGEAEWHAEIEPTEVVDLFAVRLMVDFSESPEDMPPSYEEELFLLRPTWSESDERDELLDDKRRELERSRDFDRF